MTAQSNQLTVEPSTLTTAEAARALRRSPNTLRKWASLGEGPVRPRRIYGRLAWPRAEIEQLIGGAPA